MSKWFERLQSWWTQWRIAVGSSAIVIFLVVPFGIAVRDRVYKSFFDTPEYSLSVYVCIPVGVLRHEIIDSTGKRFPLPPAFLPTPFQVLIQNNGSRHLEAGEILVQLNKDNSDRGISDKSELTMSDVLLASNSPLDQAIYNATPSHNSVKITAKRMNPSDFILFEGILNRPANVDVFFRAVGLTAHEKKGVADCGYFSKNIGDAFIFFREPLTNP